MTTYKNFTVRDCGGNVHEISVPRNRGLPAMDALPSNMSRRPVRDQEQGGPDIPNRIDDGQALEMITQILQRVGDPGALMAQVQRVLDSGEAGNSSADEYPARPGFVPNAGGKTSPKLPMDSARLSMDRADPTLRGFLDRIKLHGY